MSSTSKLWNVIQQFRNINQECLYFSPFFILVCYCLSVQNCNKEQENNPRDS